MNDINFDITKHWLPVGEKQGSIEKDTLRIKVSGINFHTKPEANFWGVFTGCIKTEPNNPYDTNAIGFYKTDGQLLGFVQKELQDYVNKFSKGKELDCVIAITPFISKDGKVRNQAYATILKFFEDDIEYATEMINRITEDVGNDAFIEITHFEKELPTLNVSQPKVDDKDNNNEDNDSNVIFRYDEFYKFPQSDKTGKKTYDTLTVRIEDADWYFDRKKWQAGVFSGYVDVVHLESLNQYGIYREDNTLVGRPNSFDFDDEIKGLEGYQHPSRWKMKKMSRKADYFSELIIYTSLMTFAEIPSLWKDKNIKDTETMLFSADDIKSRGKSSIFAILDSNTHLAQYSSAIKKELMIDNIEDLQPLEDVVVSNEQKIVSSAQEKWKNNGYVPEIVDYSNSIYSIQEKWKDNGYSACNKEYDIDTDEISQKWK